MAASFTVGIVTMMNSVARGSNKSSRTLAVCCLSSSSLEVLKQDDQLVVCFSTHININQLGATYLQLIACSPETTLRLARMKRHLHPEIAMCSNMHYTSA